jgi:hypothetical protein
MSGHFLVCGERSMCEEQRQYTLYRVLFFLCLFIRMTRIQM